MLKRLSYLQKIRTHRLVIVGSKADVARNVSLLREIVSTMEYYDEVDYIHGTIAGSLIPMLNSRC